MHEIGHFGVFKFINIFTAIYYLEVFVLVHEYGGGGSKKFFGGMGGGGEWG